MKIRQQIRRSPNATPVAAESVRVRRHSDNATLTLTSTDSDGFVTYSVGGSPGEVYFHLQGVPGGDKYWSSYDAMAAGAISLPELPVGLRAMGDGVVRGFASAFSVQGGHDADIVLVNTGAALVGGYPVVYATVGQALVVTRPAASTRTDRVVIRVYPNTSSTTPGKAEVALLAGVEGGSAPSLTQTDQVYEISLAQVTVPVSLPITITDEREYVGETPVLSGVARASSASTTNSSGEALTGLTVNLTLPQRKPYTVSAEITGVQTVATGWVNQGTFGSFGTGIAPNFNGPRQVAVDASGNVYVVDAGNKRVVKLDSGGTFVAQAGTSPATPIGIALDEANGRMFIAQNYGTNGYLARWSMGMVFQTSAIVGSGRLVGHLATDGTHVYIIRDDNVIIKRLAADSSFVSFWGSTGTGNGQFQAPLGICADGTHVYVSDDARNDVQKFTTAGGYATKWSSAGQTALAVSAAGSIWAAGYGTSELYEFDTSGTLLTTLSQATPGGIAFGAGDELWVSNRDSHAVSKWDELPGGHGQLAIEIDGNVCPYLGIGQRSGTVANMDVATVQGPGTCTVRAFGKATADTATFNSLVLRASAEP